MNGSLGLELVLFLSLGMIGLGALIALPSGRLPVRFRNLDEEIAVSGIARWAAQELKLDRADRRLIYALNLSVYSMNLNWLGSIPPTELAILAPFIDRMIAGEGPPLNLPAEYEDTRPATLAQFKQRMEAEGLWPEAADDASRP